MYCDIIGDIHGHADKLVNLLLKLGYEFKEGYYQHHARQVFFVGDFIDRGSQNRRVIEIVRSMVANGSAKAVMGNHEYNAICYHTPKSNTEWLRPHSKSKFKQHEEFLKEYPVGHNDTNEVIAWFKTLPLFLEEKDFRLIHACWDPAAIVRVKHFLNTDNTLKEEYIAESATKDSQLFLDIERLLKGVEIELPAPYSFKDKDGKERRHIRVKWWGPTHVSCRKAAFGYGDDTSNFPDDLILNCSSTPSYHIENKPVFFGHYWMVGTPEVQQDNVCCVDYSAGKGKKLVCYRFFKGPLDDGQFCWVDE